MIRFAFLAFAVLLSACSYTGHVLRDAGTGGSAPAAEPEDPNEERLRAPMRAPGSRIS